MSNAEAAWEKWLNDPANAIIADDCGAVTVQIFLDGRASLDVAAHLLAVAERVREAAADTCQSVLEEKRRNDGEPSTAWSRGYYIGCADSRAAIRRIDLAAIVAGVTGKATVCQWTEQDGDAGTWRTSCGKTFWTEDCNTPAESGQNYCYHCGKPVAGVTKAGQ